MADRHRRNLKIGVGVMVGVLVGGATYLSTSPGPTISGMVMDLAGVPVVGATVAMGTARASTDGAGRFDLGQGPTEGWIRADAPGYLPRLRPAMVGHQVLLRLTPDDGHTISMVFGGDVMFGRRFFDPNEDGDPSDGLLKPGSTVDDHSRLLAGVAPALEAADLAVVNLETPCLLYTSPSPRDS